MLTMPKQREYSADLKEAVINVLKQGKSQSAVGRDFGLSQQIVSVWWKKYSKAGTVQNKPRSGRPRKTTVRVDRLIKRKSTADPRKSARVIRDEIDVDLGETVHISTVKRRLAEVGLHGRRPARKPFISAKNRKVRLDFAKRHQNWTRNDWKKVLWSDESKYNLMSSDGIKYVRRPVNERYNVRYQVPTVKHGGGNVTVWGCFSRRGVGPLVRINGIMDRFVYRDILYDNMLPYGKKNMPRGWIFQQDNDPKHSSKLVKEFLQEKVKVLEWPSQSPDLNPIEHLWEELERRVHNRVYTNGDVFFKALQEEWANIPTSRLEKLVDSMPDRIAAVIKANGYTTKY